MGLVPREVQEPVSALRVFASLGLYLEGGSGGRGVGERLGRTEAEV